MDDDELAKDLRRLAVVVCRCCPSAFRLPVLVIVADISPFAAPAADTEKSR